MDKRSVDLIDSVTIGFYDELYKLAGLNDFNAIDSISKLREKLQAKRKTNDQVTGLLNEARSTLIHKVNHKSDE